MADKVFNTPEGALTKSQRTKLILLNAGRKAFSEGGWANTRIKDITAYANVSHGTFYTYFKNREILLDELIKEATNPLLELVAAPWRADTPEEGLREIITSFLDVYTDAADIIETWRQAAEEAPHFKKSWDRIHRYFISRVAHRLEGLARVSGVEVEQSFIYEISHVLVTMVVAKAQQLDYTGLPRQYAIDAMVIIWAGAINQLFSVEVVETTPARHNQAR